MYIYVYGIMLKLLKFLYYAKHSALFCYLYNYLRDKYKIINYI